MCPRANAQGLFTYSLHYEKSIHSIELQHFANRRILVLLQHSIPSTYIEFSVAKQENLGIFQTVVPLLMPSI